METHRCGDHRIVFTAEKPHIYEVELPVRMFDKLTSIYYADFAGVTINFSNHPFFPLCPYWYSTLGRNCRKVRADSGDEYALVPIPLPVVPGREVELEFSIPVGYDGNGRYRVIDTEDPCPSIEFFGYEMIEIPHGADYGKHELGRERTTDMFVVFGANLTTDLVLDIPGTKEIEFRDGYHVYHFPLQPFTELGIYRRGLEGVQRVFIMGLRPHPTLMPQRCFAPRGTTLDSF